MSWNMDVQYVNANHPYYTSGSFMEYFEGLTYEHVNFIFSGASHGQDLVYPSVNTGYYKFGMPESGSYSYYEQDGHNIEANNHEQGGYYYMDRSALASSPVTIEEHAATAATGARNENAVANSNASSRDGPAVCPRRHQSSHDYQVVWQDSIDPDNMTYEELLELGEVVGTQSRGLSHEHISKLPVSKYKCGFFFKRKSRERCVICQMNYKRGDRQMTLPCKHVYHAGCGSRWLSINKACPICYTEVEVFVDASQLVKKGIRRR